MDTSLESLPLLQEQATIPVATIMAADSRNIRCLHQGHLRLFRRNSHSGIHQAMEIAARVTSTDRHSGIHKATEIAARVTSMDRHLHWHHHQPGSEHQKTMFH